MKTTRTFASFCLTASCIALVAAANVSVGDQPGVFHMTSVPQENTPEAVQNRISPVPDTSVAGPNGATAPGQVHMNSGSNPPLQDAAQFLQRSAGVTAPVMGSQAFKPQPLMGPQMTFSQNIDDSIGMQDSYTRINALIPNHLMPDTTILGMSLSASLTADGRDLYNYGAIFRHYDESRNRVWGLNVFGDFDNTAQLTDYSRVGFGIENLGRYVDFIFNGYMTTGDSTVLDSTTALTGLTLTGNNVVGSFTESRENAYQGFDWKIGTPVPWLGRRGLKTFLGSYYLESDFGDEEALGLSVQVQLQATESLEVNAFYTNDKVFGTNSWVNIAYTIPHRHQKTILRPKTVRQRLMDPVRRTNTIHTKLESTVVSAAEINPETGLPWFINYVDPNATTTGTGTIEDPFSTLELAAAANAATVDAIRLTPRTDGTGTGLTVDGGLELLADQALFSSHKDFTLFTDAGADFVIPANAAGPGPLVSNPTIVAGGSVIRVNNGNRIEGLRIDGGNADGTAFGMGIAQAGATVVNATIQDNIFTNYTTGVSLDSGSGELLFDENTFTGFAGVSTHGLMLTTTVDSTSDLRLSTNTATDNSTVGLYVAAGTDSIINADNPSGSGAVEPTGIIDNNVSAGGDGIVVTADTGATIQAVVERNTSTDNTLDGFTGRADGGTINLASLRDNTFTGNLENGGLLHFLNGGTIDSSTEDVNGDGILDPAEDINGNGLLDEGIVSNTMSDNGLSGLCLFGQDDSIGDFDIGGPVAGLGNTFNGNIGAGIAVDLRDSSTAGIDALFNTITSEQSVSSGPPALTFVLDFWETSQGAYTDSFGNDITAFDVTGFGFDTSAYDVVTNAVLGQVQNHYYGIPTVGTDALSSIPDGQQLAIDFVIGDVGTAPSNGATEYYYTVIGGSTTPETPLGIGWLSAARDASGAPNGGFAVGDQLSSVYSDNINGLGGLTPADIGSDHVHGDDHTHDTDLAIAGDNTALQDALTSGNLTFTRNALGGTISHEIGHNLSLEHLNAAGAVTPSGNPPIMGTGALDLSNQARIGPREFAYTGQNGEEGNATQTHVQQLVDALGTRTAITSGVSGDGIVIVATDEAVLEQSTFLNNTITNNSGDALSIQMNDEARAEDVTIQTNVIQNNAGRGIDLQANGALAFIDASNTIGGAGTNTLNSSSYTQGNTIIGNQSDGIRVLTSDGGTVWGNAINNTITSNAGNGIALLVDVGGTVDFGTTSSRLISGNTINGNGGAGILANSNVEPTVSNADQQMDIVVQGNTISQNLLGGIIAEMNGSNNVAGGPPDAGFDQNNVLNLTIGQTTGPLSTVVASEVNTLNQNGNTGIGVILNGNGLANLNIAGNSITNSTAGTDALFVGNGINLIRRDASLLLADIDFNTITGHASHGLEVDTQGTDGADVNLPDGDPGATLNSVTWNNNTISINGVSGASFTTRGDSQLLANGEGNLLQYNAVNGVQITTSENSSFGDVGGSQKTIFNGFVIDSNGQDGVNISATEETQVLLQITSESVATSPGAHDCCGSPDTLGDTVISNNGRDGVHIETGIDFTAPDSDGGLQTATVDVLITAETPISATSAITQISGNGTIAGGNGVRLDEFSVGGSSLDIRNTLITGNIAGTSETSDLNGTIDVLDGDGVQFNYFLGSANLRVGASDEGNIIQSNGDDGIAITGHTDAATTGLSGFDVAVYDSTPTIVIEDNLIGSTNNGIAAGNTGDGISIAGVGRTHESGLGTIDNDSNAIGDGLTNPDEWGVGREPGHVTQGPTPNITINENTISRNNQDGVLITLNGANGTTNFHSSLPNMNQIALTDNLITSNGRHGIFLRADSDMHQQRFQYLPQIGPIDLDAPPDGFDESYLDAGIMRSTISAGVPDSYINTESLQNSFLTISGNTIQANGVNTVTGNGLRMLVGTGAYVAADVTDNTFGGNLEEDMLLGSFLSDVETKASGDYNNAGERDDPTTAADETNITYDYVFENDVALLDMRFTGNEGDQLELDDPNNSAFYGIGDGKYVDDIMGPDPNRYGNLFKIDDYTNLDTANGVFQTPGQPALVLIDLFTDAFEIKVNPAEPMWPAGF